jgi:hypothetical protein
MDCPEGAQAPFNELDEYQTGRYISAGEAAWRILGYNITSLRPSVTSLSVHLPDSLRHRQYRRKDQSEMTNLHRYFLRPLGSFTDHDGSLVDFDELTYTSYYEQFYHVRVQVGEPAPERGYATRDDSHANKCIYYAVQRLPSNRHIARIHTYRPGAGEPFYISILLRERPAISWDDLRTVNGVLYDNYQEAVVASGLFGNGNEGNWAMSEAIDALATPSELRVLFAHLMAMSVCDTPLLLWHEHKDKLSDDFFYLDAQENREEAIDMALQSLGELLEESGQRLSDFGLPEPLAYTRLIQSELRKYTRYRDDMSQAARTAYDLFNPGQRTAYDAITQAVQDRNSERRVFFIAGGAGRGKTYLVNALCDWVRGRGEIALPTATSASAATLYRGGRTTHSTFRVCVFS